MEEGSITLGRAAATVRYPSRFMLVAAMNPCPCGYLGDTRHECLCTPRQVERYRARLSGPLLDRIDLHVEVPAVEVADITADERSAETSAQIATRVEAARAHQRQRFAADRAVADRGMHCNADMDTAGVRRHCRPLAKEAAHLLRNAMERLALSARAHDRILKVARTIADLAGEDRIGAGHVAEAVQYRCLDRR